MDKKRLLLYAAYAIGMLLILLITDSVGRAQGRDQDMSKYTTNDLFNGRGWNSINENTKLGILLGIANCAKLEQTMARGKSAEVKTPVVMYPSGLAYGETMKAVDAFFSEPTNANIPVLFALGYIQDKAAGSSEAELKKFERQLRESYRSSDALGKGQGNSR